MFRRVELSVEFPGRLLLHSMPGRFEAIEMVWHHLRSEEVGAIVCLTEKYEIRRNSSKYAEAVENGTVPCSVLPFEVSEGGGPDDRDGHWGRPNDVAHRLQSGDAVLIHCAGGVGRTAMLAIAGADCLGRTDETRRNARSRALVPRWKQRRRSKCLPGAP